MSTSQIHPEPGCSFIVICKQDNKPETNFPPSYKFVHPSFCPSICQSTCQFIHSILLIDLVVEEGQGMSGIALCLWPLHPGLKNLLPGLAMTQGCLSLVIAWPGEGRLGLGRTGLGTGWLGWCFSITLFQGSEGHGQEDIFQKPKKILTNTKKCGNT